MNKLQFYEWVGRKYRVENPLDLEDFTRYIDDNYKYDDYSMIQNGLLENYAYKGLPSVKNVKDIIGDERTQGQDNPKYDDILRHNRIMTDAWKAWPLKSIIARLLIINQKETMNGSEMEFWGMFSEIFYEMQHMKEKEYSKEGMADHLGGCLDLVRKGQPFRSIIEREQIQIGQVFDQRQMKKDLNKKPDSREGI